MHAFQLTEQEIAKADGGLAIVTRPSQSPGGGTHVVYAVRVATREVVDCSIAYGYHDIPNRIADMMRWLDKSGYHIC